jgi:hypothetical protein
VSRSPPERERAAQARRPRLEAKRCPGCERDLPAADFRRWDCTPDGLSARCLACLAEFTRGPREPAALAPPGHKHCSGCCVVKPADQFHIRSGSADGLQWNCKSCVLARLRARAETDRGQEWASDRRSKAWPSLVASAKRRAKARNLPYDLDDHLEAIAERCRAMRCEITGVRLVVTPPGHKGAAWNTPSFHRVVPPKGYVLVNLKITCWLVNAAIGSWGEGRLREVMGAWEARESDAPLEALARCLRGGSPDRKADDFRNRNAWGPRGEFRNRRTPASPPAAVLDESPTSTARAQ